MLVVDPPKGRVATEMARVAARNRFGETARPRGKAEMPCVATEMPVAEARMGERASE